MTIKLWHDDVRPAPEGWVWARTNESAIGHLRKGSVDEISLDHDLGLGLDHLSEEQIDEDPELLFSQGTGYDLVGWMVESGNVPETITVHSWNPAGASKMAAKFNDHGYSCVVRPFMMLK